MSEWVDQIVSAAYEIRTQLTQHPTIGQFIDPSLPIPKPFLATGIIKLVVIGQDPTVKNVASRGQITTVLNLDKQSSLTRYLESICVGLGLSLRENVYATNACKNFFTHPPTVIQKDYKVDVVRESAALWLPLLLTELVQFPGALIISLGEPVLRMLVRDDGGQQIKYYWGYSAGWQEGKAKPFSMITPEISTVDRILFPFPHQPSMRQKFYGDRLSAYIEFVQTQQREG